MSFQRLCTGLWALASVALPGAALGYAELSYETNIYSPAGTAHYADTLGMTDSIAGGHLPACVGPCGNSGAVAWAGGYADATRLQSGMLATAGSFSRTEGSDAKAALYLTNTFVVKSATLNAGDAVTLHFDVGLQGRLSATSATQTHGLVAIGVIAGATVPRPGGPGEFTQPLLAGFTANWDISEIGGYGLYTGIGWQLDHRLKYNQNNYGFTGSGSYRGLCNNVGDPATCFYSYAGAGQDPYGHAIPVVMNLAVPALTASFTAYVGETYSIFSYLATTYAGADGLANAMQPSDTTADFRHTLSGQVQPAQDDVTLDWQIPLAAVPEPSTWAMWALGMSLLAATVRRSKRR